MVKGEIGLLGNPSIQPCRRLHVDTDVLMEDASLQVRGLAESEFNDMTNVRITDRVATLGHSLPNTLILQEHPNFTDIDYPLLDRDHCNHPIRIHVTKPKLIALPDPCMLHIHVSAGSFPDMNA